MCATNTLNLRADFPCYGISEKNVRDLGRRDSVELLDYLDLLPPTEGSKNGGADVMPDYVAESQGRPLLFIVNESRLAQSPEEQERQIRSLRKKLASRGERTYLARIRPGELAVIPVSLSDRTTEELTSEARPTRSPQRVRSRRQRPTAAKRRPRRHGRASRDPQRRPPANRNSR